MVRLTESLPLNLAYAAGLFDGEGSVGFTKTSSGYRLRVSMNSTDLALVRFMHQQFGGCLYEEIDRRRERHQHQWIATGEVACRFLEAVRPYMREARKIARADIVIGEYIPLHGANRNGRNAVLRNQRNEVAERVRAI